MPELKIRLFGAFRNLQSEPEISVRLADDQCTVAGLKAELSRRWREKTEAGFDAAGLLSKSAVASDVEILLEEQVLAAGDSLALLPPVSGG